MITLYVSSALWVRLEHPQPLETVDRVLVSSVRPDGVEFRFLRGEPLRFPLDPTYHRPVLFFQTKS